ncbi:MAG: MFS transporter [Sphingorhabdus sp.]|jgi:MFS family permease|uniref:MFS transporter n=1 Tax=Sphingorhabdus sp. TaxID=1902408 RepID=UPI0025CECB9A|nr:MFS transporter [Sphingorhabdus sp.]MCO4091361.1 MFS transporter [Sphingorhabdus sp.]
MSIDATAADQQQPEQPLGWAWYGLAVVVLASVIGSLIGKGLISLVAESMKQSLKLTDGELGIITGLALTFVVAIASYPIGWLADRVDRRWLLAGCVMIWSAATVGFGLSDTFTGLVFFAMGIAFGEAVLGPVTNSMIPDLFPKDRWVTANLIFVSATLLGTYLGMALGGTLFGVAAANAQSLPVWLAGLEPWRITLILAALTGPILAMLILLMRLKRITPPSKAGEAVEGVVDYFRTNARTTAGIFFGFGLSYAAMGAQGQWNAVILQRVFGQTPMQIGQTLGVAGGVAALAGVGMAWIVVKLLRPRYGDNTPMRVAVAALTASLIVSLPIPLVVTAEQFYATILAKICFTFMANSLAPTVLQLMAPAHLRGRVVAVGGMVTIIFASFMPWVVGLLSDQFFPGHRGILLAVAIIVIPGLLGGILFLAWGLKGLPQTIMRANGGQQA